MKFPAVLLTLPLLWFFAGCCWMLPPGTPPEGAIVTEEIPAARDLRGAENDLVTSLFAYTLSNCPGAAIAVDAEEPLFPLARRVIERTGAISGIRFAPEGRYLLRARINPPSNCVRKSWRSHLPTLWRRQRLLHRKTPDNYILCRRRFRRKLLRFFLPPKHSGQLFPGRC